MSTYTPRFVQNSTCRWGAELKPVVNTSLPAQNAPKLAPVTLAAATKATATKATTAKATVLEPLRPRRSAANVTSMEDFPTLGKPVASVKAPSMNFASLSRDWAQKQKEDSAKAKEEAEKEAYSLMVQQKEREKDDKERREMRKAGIISIPQLNSKKMDEDDLRFKEEEKKEESDLSDDPLDELCDDDDIEDEFDDDGNWNPRKHRDELY